MKSMLQEAKVKDEKRHAAGREANIALNEVKVTNENLEKRIQDIEKEKDELVVKLQDKEAVEAQTEVFKTILDAAVGCAVLNTDAL